MSSLILSLGTSSAGSLLPGRFPSFTGNWIKYTHSCREVKENHVGDGNGLSWSLGGSSVVKSFGPDVGRAQFINRRAAPSSDRRRM